MSGTTWEQNTYILVPDGNKIHTYCSENKTNITTTLEYILAQDREKQQTYTGQRKIKQTQIGATRK